MKPVIFFSHSSQDRHAILPIRNQLLKGTSNAIEVFMSSDGQSIPLGRNWLKEVEDALGRCKVMFVWMTPGGMTSRWLLFEAGYAYSKGIRVIPIGFQGVGLETVQGPISILQGFNVTSAKGLNNILAIINQEFALTVPDLFDDTFYVPNATDIDSEDSPNLYRYIRSITCRFGAFVKDGGGRLAVRQDWNKIILEMFSELSIPVTDGHDGIFGLGFRVRGSGSRDDNNVALLIDPLALNQTQKMWAILADRLYQEPMPMLYYTPVFVDGAKLPEDPSLVGSRLLNSEVSFDTKHPHVVYRYRNISFRFTVETSFHEPQSKRRLILLVPRENEEPIPLYSLLKLLEERRVISVP